MRALQSHAADAPEGAATGDGRATTITALLGLLTSIATGAACVGPFIAILLGVGGFGWLTQYAYLRVPASLMTAAILGVGFARLYGPARREAPGCSARRDHRGARVLLWIATTVAIAINLFEYVVLPRLG